MKKLHTSFLFNSFLLTLCYAQQINSMDLSLYTKEEQKNSSQKFNDEMSKKLYKSDITAAEIKELVANGADVNYKNNNDYSDPIPIFYAKNKTPEGLKNMKTILSFGAHRHYGSYTETPLTIAAYDNNINMVHLLISYETTKETFLKNGGSIAINAAFYYQSFDLVKELIEKKFMTPNQGVKEYIRWRKSLTKIIHYLKEQGATNISTELITLIDNEATFSPSACDIIKSICEVGIHDASALKNLINKRDILNSCIQTIEKNSPK